MEIEESVEQEEMEIEESVEQEEMEIEESVEREEMEIEESVEQEEMEIEESVEREEMEIEESVEREETRTPRCPDPASSARVEEKRPEQLWQRNREEAGEGSGRGTGAPRPPQIQSSLFVRSSPSHGLKALSAARRVLSRGMKVLEPEVLHNPQSRVPRSRGDVESKDASPWRDWAPPTPLSPQPLPYVAPVAGGLWPGMAIYVQGVVKPQPDRFRIDLATGPSKGADVVLHLNPRFGEGVAVLNSRRGKHWGDEQRRELHPLCPGGPFEIVISVTPEGYRILVNGTFFEQFPHRLPPEQVTAVTVDGDLELHSASVMGGAGACPPCVPVSLGRVGGPKVGLGGTPAGFEGSPGDGAAPHLPPDRALHRHHFRVGLVPKKTIVIKGFIPHNAGRFHINLRAGPGGDVVLHLNPRMDEGGAVVRNAFLGGCWGEEERDISCCHPFQRGRYFDLSIRCGNHRFKVFAEGQPLLDFRHRVPSGPHVNVLEIEGDVVLSYVHF
ncbi:galectin-4-like [Cyanocitta cristata]